MATTTLTGTTGNDILNTPGSVSALAAGFQGNDTITLARVDDQAQGGAGADLIQITNNGTLANTIVGGSGNDTVTLTSAVTVGGSIALNDGDDRFVLTAGQIVSASIGGNAGNDVISFRGGINSATVGGGANNDSIALTAGTLSLAAIIGGGGKDTLNLSTNGASTQSTIQAADGHDKINITGGANFGTNSMVGAGKGIDSITVGNSLFASLAGGGGADNITFTGATVANSLIFGDGFGVTEGGSLAGADNITTTASVAAGTTIYGAGGADTISFQSAATGNTVIDGGNDGDLIGTTATNVLNTLTVTGAAGADSIRLNNIGTNMMVLGGAGHDTVLLQNTGLGSVNGGAGIDYISTQTQAGLVSAISNTITINGGAGADSISIIGAAAGGGNQALATFQSTGITAATAGIIGNVVYGSGDTVALGTATINAATTANWVTGAASLRVSTTFTGLAAALTAQGGIGSIAVFDEGDDLTIAISQSAAGTLIQFLNIIGGGSLIASGNALTAGAYTLNSSNFGFTLSEINAAGGININFT